MARVSKKESRSFKRAEPSTKLLSIDLIDSIKKLVIESAKKASSYDELLFKLKRWWCHQYNRPYKDPLLDSYSFEELYFEYYDVTGMKADEEDDAKVNTEIPQDEWDWAEQAEKEEEEAELAKQNAEKGDTIEDGSQSDEEWATKVLTNPTANEVDDGGDINTNFGG